MSWWRRQPLRTQLVIIVVALGAAALTLAGVTAAIALNSFLQGQTDQQLMAASRPGAPPPTITPVPGTRGPGHDARFDDDHGYESDDDSDDESDDDDRVPAEFYIAAVDPAGRLQVLGRPAEGGGPELRSLPAPGTLATVPGRDGPWRVLTRQYGPDVIVYAKSLAPSSAAVARLAALEVVVGLLVLTGLALAARFAIRRSLRPLQEVEHTATAIAAGDLQQRVAAHEPGTEVGQLSIAFNTMVDEVTGTIEQRDAALTDARASEARMRQFVADASHELRTPLTTIRGYSELYRQGGIADADVPATFHRLEGEAQRMGGLVDDLLLLARLDQQRPLERRPVDLLRVTSDAVHSAAATHPDRSVRLRTEGDAEPLVTGDEARLRQVVSNLIGNALKYSDGEVAVTVATSTPGRVLLSVADSGPGIPDAEKPKVFERFYRGDPSRTRSAGGSGLGLSIVSAIATAHGGVVSVTDNPGGGSRFQVALPAL